jgi:hypothetical protein
LLSDDFNKDGHADLVTGLVIAPESTGAQFGLLAGIGDGNFSAPILSPAIENSDDSPIVSNWLAAGDLNGDGFLDLVVTTSFAQATSYLNQNGTAFVGASGFGPNDSAVTVALADVNNDGCLDAVEAGAAGFLTIATGNCNGSFTQHDPVASLGDVDVALNVVDVNGDGKPDVVAAAAFNDTEAPYDLLPGAYGGYLVSVLAGDGSGGFAPASLYRVASQAYDLTVSDLRNSGKPDIVTVGQLWGEASYLANDGTGGFGTPAGETIGYLHGVYNAPVPYTPVQTIDLNGDGKADVLFVEYGQTNSVPPQMTALLNQGNGRLSAPIRSAITVGPTNPYLVIAAGNFRNANVADVIYVDENTLPNVAAFMRGNGDGTFAAPVTLASLPSPCAIVTGDFNHDGKLDFAVWGYATAGTSDWEEIDVFLGNGDGTFKQIPPKTFAPLTAAQPQQFIVGDFNHDGKLDLLMGHNTNSGWVDSGDDLDIALGNGDGTFQPVVTLMAHFGPVAAGDLNHDGYLDLVQARDPNQDTTQEALTAAGGAFITPAMTIYLGGAGGTFTQRATYFTPGIQIPSYAPALVGDFNGDGNLDAALPYVPATIGRPWERRLQLFQGAGDGTFTSSGITYPLPVYDQPVVGGDYRGLGVTDLLDMVGATSSINTISAVPAPALAITFDASPLSTNTGSVTVTLASPSASSQTIQQQSFSFTVGAGVDASHLLAFTASVGTQSATAYVATKVNPNLSPGVVALMGSTTSGTPSVATSPGVSLPLILTLQSLRGYSGIFGNFTCAGLPSGASCDFAASSLTLPAGRDAQVAFTLNTSATTPAGTYDVMVGATNGELNPAVSISLGIGGFSISLNPALIQVNGDPAAQTTVAANFTNGYNQSITLACNGLPSPATCVVPSVLYPGAASTPVSVANAQQLAAQDYPFSVIGTVGALSSTTPATLRVSNFTAVLQSTTASLSEGQSAGFNILLTSNNHFSNGNLSVLCQAPSAVTCATKAQYGSLADNGTATITFTATYQASLNAARSRRKPGPWLPAFLLPFVLLAARRRGRSRWSSLSILIAGTLLASSFTACGGGGKGGSTAPIGTSPAAQTISVPVTVQADTGSGILQEGAGTVVLTVQP